ncbi:histidine kinase [Fibrisoma limi BUZ 3]|uniref:histidine kinase n=1 Tax=Fibrisoma limi BUZ 3 TaxID=1185876 RepID=I2GFU9_9BACT|nr:hybrid sensor histidine kinase/response regulator transcription factor [Fibrisoma limi]CCH52774.1 histidine kinase [Fibrisoma limi BUZ 3]
MLKDTQPLFWRVRLRRLLFLTGLAVLLVRPGFSQVKFHKISTAQGLSQSSVVAIHEDKQGFLWLGTADGLNRYDGYGFTVYRHLPHDSTSLPSSHISALDEDSNGRLWVGTITGGACYLDRSTGHFVRVPLLADRRSITIVSSIVAQGSDVWVGSDAAGLFHIDTRTRKTRWLSKRGGPVFEPNVTALAEGRNNTCWAGTGDGTIYQLSSRIDRPLRRLVVARKAGANRINRLFEDSRGRLWISTEANGVYRLDPGHVQPERVLYVPNQPGGINSVQAFEEDRRHNLWLGTDDGVLVAPGGNLTQSRHYRAGPDSEFGLSSHAVKSIRQDRNGNIWIGTWEAGLNVVYRLTDRFQSLTYKPNEPNGLPARKVTAVGGDRQGGIWIGTNMGLTYWQPNRHRFTHYRPPNLSGLDVNLVYTHPTDQALVGVWNKAFDVWNPKSGRFQNLLGRLTADDTSVTNSVKAFCRARDGRVWVVSQNAGIVRFDPATLQSESIPPAVDGVDVRRLGPGTVCETADGTLWMGMFNNGLWAYDLRTRRTQHYQASNQRGSLSENHILTLFEDSKKRLWIGTNGGGLNQFDPKTGRFIVYTTEHGLANNTVKGILEDDHGNLWMATNDGLSKLEINRRQFTTYTVHDGLPSREFLVGACYKSPDGHMYFGTMDGLAYFHPDSIESSREALPIYLTGLRLFNRPVTVGVADSPLQRPVVETDVLTLRHDQSVFTIDFLALNLQNAPNLQYAYRIDAFDPDWNYVGTQRSATYTNLDPGEYVFRVKAANGAGPWTEATTTLTIRILPPWYRTWWAYTLYALILFATLLAWRRLIKIRERFRSDLRLKTLEAETMREVDRVKTSFFTNISHEFRTPLTLIISPLEKLLTDPAPEDSRTLRQQHGLMHRNAQRLLRLINQLLDLAKLEAGHLQPGYSRNTLPDFMSRLVASFDFTAQQHAIDLTFTADFPNVPVWYDPDLLEKTLSNLISNALKFTPDGGQVSVTLHEPEPTLARITVQDSGIGMSPDHLTHIFDRFYQVDDKSQSKTVGTGIGLALTKELIELVGGAIEVESEPGRGSTFVITLPVGEPKQGATRVPSGNQLSLPKDAILTQEITRTGSPPAISIRRDLLLIVEDNDELRSYMSELFATQYEVLEAVDGQDGWEKAQTTNPALIISDLMMPRLNGIELCRLVKSHNQTSHIPFILLTARQNTDSQLDGYGAGADDYVSKPFNAHLLQSRVQNLLRTREKLRERFSRVITVQPSELTVTSADDQFLTKALQVIEQQLANPDFGINELIDAMNMSETLLYRKLKSLTGLSGNEFIRSIRLKRAAQWLQSEADLTVSEVAYRVGFRDPAYFTRCFTKEFGRSPKQFAAASASSV